MAMNILGFVICGMMGILWCFVGKHIGMSQAVICFGAVPIGAVTMLIVMGATK